MEGSPTNRIRELREARHQSLRDLAQLAGMDVNRVHRLETGAIKLDIDSMRRITAAWGLRPSALLLDEDVEMRADEIGSAIMSELSAVDGEARLELFHMARELVRLVRTSAATKTAGALSGTNQQVSELAEAWNAFTPEARDRALGILKLAGSRG